MKRLFYILSCFIVFTSCEDFLNREPVEQVSISQQFSSVEGLLQTVSGVYSAYEALYSSISFIYADAIAGNVKFAPNQQGFANVPDQFQPVYAFQEQSDEGTYTSYYQNAYSIINALNLILENIDNVPELDASLEQQIRAETLAMRASVHFELSRLFAQTYDFSAEAQHPGIVYNTRTLEAGEDFPARATVAETYNLIETDFLEALNLFTENAALPGPETSYFNPNNVRGLLSRLYLYKEDWENCIAVANDVLDSGISLTPRDLFVEQWTALEPISEALFEFSPPVAGDDGTLITSSVSQYYGYVFLNGELADYARYTASNDLVSLYEDDDIRGPDGMLVTLNIPTQTGTDLEEQPYIFTQKYVDDDGAIMIRLSEILLNKAEAHARLNQNQLALSDLQNIRERANPNADLLNLSGQALIDEILLERRRELAFEGHFLFDLARNGLSIIRNDGCNISICQLDYPNNRFILPIPQSSILINENMVQNEGY
jgi:hypothetical protein